MGAQRSRASRHAPLVDNRSFLLASPVESGFWESLAFLACCSETVSWSGLRSLRIDLLFLGKGRDVLEAGVHRGDRGRDVDESVHDHCDAEV